ncbi:MULTISPECIES: hypothetical protein [unclassified Streptomyces]|uniref:hypothetical protein n=1 Tax=unclassified Streptomyces TaxID=2593676 RepID=UPI00224D179B|nr:MULTISPECIES: hypothetical protein [unclassified Streptomyces]MCX5328357.1 hypothetical protein [Streptomyces sp. NBC_00140]MCX5357773.1 hypothetical protein [Streptomyces sp. NBC_00124]
MGAFGLAVQARVAGLEVSVGDAFVEDVPVEGGLEFGAVVGLDDLDLERQAVDDVWAMLSDRECYDPSRPVVETA